MGPSAQWGSSRGRGSRQPPFGYIMLNLFILYKYVFVASPNKRNSFRRIPSCAEDMVSGCHPVFGSRAREWRGRMKHGPPHLARVFSKRQGDEAVIIFKAVDHGKMRIGPPAPWKVQPRIGRIFDMTLLIGRRNAAIVRSLVGLLGSSLQDEGVFASLKRSALGKSI